MECKWKLNEIENLTLAFRTSWYASLQTTKNTGSSGLL